MSDKKTNKNSNKKSSKKVEKKGKDTQKSSKKSAKQNKANLNEPLQTASLNSPNSTHSAPLNSPNSARLNSSTLTNSANANSALNLANNKTKKTFWPYGILLALFAIVGACIATIIYASNYPVYEDDSFLKKYQEVDYSFNEIQQKDEAFKREFRVSLNLKPRLDERKREIYEIKAGTKELEFFVQELWEDRHANDIKPTILLTRPHTSTQDSWLLAGKLVLNNAPYVINARGQKSTRLKKSFNRYTFKATLPELEIGRWQVKLNAQKDEKRVGFYEFNLIVVP